MTIIQHPKDLYAIQDDGVFVKVVIPRKNYSKAFFICLFLIGWAFGEFFTLEHVITTALSWETLFLLVWLGIWTLCGVALLHEIFWQALGIEIVEIGIGSIKIHRAIFNSIHTKEYLGDRIKDLRVSPLDEQDDFGFWGSKNGIIAFNYGVETIRFGPDDDVAQAERILEKITTRFPRYRTLKIING